MSSSESNKRMSVKSEEGHDSRKDKDEVGYGITSLKSAAHEAAMADGLIPVDSASAESKAKKAGLRRGKWTAEEESYANRLIYEFKLGLLPLTDGTTLRTFLSKLLNCDPMRISKKFVGQNCIGKQVFRRRQQDLEKLTPAQIETSRKELAELERKFLERVAQTNRTKPSTGTKDGRPGYEDENGNPILAPWMLPPDEVVTAATSHSSENVSSARNNTANSSTNPSSSSSFPSESGTFLNSSSSSFPPGRVLAAYPQNAEPGSVEYQQMVNMNNAMMSQLYHGMAAGGPVPYFLPPGYPAPPGMVAGGKAEAGGLPRPPSFDVFYNMDQARMLHAGGVDGQFRGSFPWVGSSEGIAAAFGSNVSLPFAAHDWPSMTNLINSGESMENIAQYLTQYQTAGQQTDRGNGGVDKENNKEDKATRVSGEDVGLSIDDPTPAPSGKHYGFNGNWKAPPTKPNDTEKSVEKTVSSRNSTESYSIPSDSLAVMAPMYSRHSTDSKTTSTVAFPPKAIQASPGLLGLGTSPAGNPNMPRNSSVENFWMLVDMGDLPRPDQGVLSETLWQAKTTTITNNRPDFPMKATKAVAADNGVSSTNGSTRIDKIVDSNGHNNGEATRKRPEEEVEDAAFEEDSTDDHLLKKVKVEHGTSSA